MADSNITKKVLSAALKELISETPFDKITIKDICDKCEMNRKSFYYHFKDKYDLVNHIFYTEFILPSKAVKYNDGFDFFLDLCRYLEENRIFYKKLLKCNDRNSFLNYLASFLNPYIRNYAEKVFQKDENIDFYVSVYSDTIIHTVKKWLSSANPEPYEKFVYLIRNCIYKTAGKLPG